MQFITTVIHSPKLLILDEPGSGLDPVNQEVLRDTILGARTQGRTRHHGRATIANPDAYSKNPSRK